MPEHSLLWTRKAIKAVRRLPVEKGRKVLAALQAFAKDPDCPSHDWKQLQGRPYGQGYVRTGSARAICERRGNELVVLVVKIGFRGDV